MIENFEDFFPDDENEIKEMLKERGIDLDELEKEFENYHPRRPLKFEKITEDVVTPLYQDLTYIQLKIWKSDLLVEY